MRRNVSLRDRVCDPCAGKHIPDDMVGFYSAYADASMFIAFHQGHAISSKLLVYKGGCVEKIITPPPWFPGDTRCVVLRHVADPAEGVLGEVSPLVFR